MSKWKCEICGNKFENFHAQGFDNKIYCPLCYFKKENQELKKQLEEINYTIIPNCDIKPLIDKFRTQQKTFIKWLEDEIKRINPDNLSISELINSELDNIKLTRYLTYKESLQKYKEITEEIDNE